MKKHLLTLSLFFAVLFTYAQSTKLWGVAQHGGTYNWGTIVSLNENGTGFSVAYNFDWTYGGTPMGNIMQASDGNLYGTGYDGGSYASCVIYRFDPVTGDYTDVWDFDISNGDFPTSGMVEGANGKLYGAASGGGSYSSGVIYSYNMSTGVYTNEHSMDGSTGSSPHSCPVYSNGMLYGVTAGGGPSNYGVIYSFDVTTHAYTVLHYFTGADGNGPFGGLIKSANGKLYGMTSMGGTNDDGVIFSYDLTTSTYTKLYDFGGANGINPLAGLYECSNGWLYGTTAAGGANNQGVIFSYDPASTFFVKLHDFNGTDGSSPQSDLSFSNGMLYGSSTAGGSSGYGVIFNCDPYSGAYNKLYDFNGTTGSAPNSAFTPVVITGINEASASLQMELFPNPSNGLFTISSASEGHVVVYDVVGREVLSRNVSSGENKIDMRDQPKGAYYIKLQTEEKTLTGKILIQ